MLRQVTAAASVGLRASRACTPMLFNSKRFISVEEAREIDERAIGLSAKNPFLFSNISLDDVAIRPMDNPLNDRINPTFWINGETEGIDYVAPFAAAGFSHFSKTGDLNVEKRFSSGTVVITDLNEASQEISITATPLHAGDPMINGPVKDCIEWVDDIRNRLIEHLAENLEQYPELRDKNPAIVKQTDMAVRQAMLEPSVTKLVRSFKDSNGNEFPSLFFRRRIYFKAKPDTKVRTECDVDEEMAERGYGRLYLPVYDIDGQRVNINDVNVMIGDVVSLHCSLRASIYVVGGRAGVKLSNEVRSVTIARQGRVETSGDENTRAQKGSYVPGERFPASMSPYAE